MIAFGVSFQDGPARSGGGDCTAPVFAGESCTGEVMGEPLSSIFADCPEVKYTYGLTLLGQIDVGFLAGIWESLVWGKGQAMWRRIRSAESRSRSVGTRPGHPARLVGRRDGPSDRTNLSQTGYADRPDPPCSERCMSFLLVVQQLPGRPLRGAGVAASLGRSFHTPGIRDRSERPYDSH